MVDNGYVAKSRMEVEARCCDEAYAIRFVKEAKCRQGRSNFFGGPRFVRGTVVAACGHEPWPKPDAGADVESQMVS